MYAKGFGDFVRLPPLITVPFLSSVLATTKMPAYLDPHIALSAPISLSGSRSSSPPLPKFPIVIFSHGLGGNRFVYTSVCGDLASHGILVVAVEHRDGTASVTTFNDGNHLFYQRPYPYASEKRFRQSQIVYREQEIIRVVEFLKNVNEGKGTEANQLNGNASVNSFFKLEQLKGRLLTSHMVIAGHSFGAATAIHVIRNHSDIFRGVLLLDPWMYPVMPAKSQLPAPTLTIISQQFEKWEPNQNVLKDFVQENLLEFDNSRFLRIVNSGHQHQGDFPVLFRTAFRKIPMIGGSVDPVEALKQNNRVCLEFLRRVWHKDGEDPLWGVKWPELTGIWTTSNESEWKTELMKSAVQRDSSFCEKTDDSLNKFAD